MSAGWESIGFGMGEQSFASEQRRSTLRRYSVAGIVSIAAVVVRYGLSADPSHAFPYATMFVPVVIASFYGGFGPGLAATLLTTTLSNYLFVDPAFSLAIPGVRNVLSLLGFAVLGILISAMGERYRKALAMASAESEVRRAAQESFRASEERLRIAERLTLAGVWDWDIVANEMYWSDAYRRMFDYPLDEKPHQDKWVSSIHSEDRARVLAQIDELFRQRLHNFVLDYRILTVAGRTRWIAGNGQVFYGTDGKPRRMIGVNVDVTARKSTEEFLRGKEANVRLLLQRARIGGWEWHPDQKLAIWSDELYDVYGLDHSLPPTFDTWLSHVHPGDRDRVMRYVQQMLDSPAENFLNEYRITGSDGTERHIQDRGTVVRGEGGKSVRIVGLSIDVSNNVVPTSTRSTM